MSSRPRGQLDSLTGLRFLAAAMVFSSHLLEVFPILGAKSEVSFITAPLGLAGVGFFYVLSGFILTYVYSRRSEPLSKREFYLKRFARIWPLHFVTMMIVLLGIVTIRSQFGREHGLAQLIVNFFLLQSWWPDYKWVFCINGPSWSLSNEAFFYVIFPWLIAGGAAVFRKKLIAFTVLGAVALFVVAQLTERGVIGEPSASALMRANPLLRSFDFMIGIACGYFFVRMSKQDDTQRPTDPQSQPQRGGVGSTLIHLTVLASAVGLYWGLSFGVGNWSDFVAEPDSVFLAWLCYSGPAPLFAVIIYAFAKYSSLVSGLLSTRSMVYLGEISYPFYLIHQAVLIWFSRQAPADSPNAILWLAAATFCFSLAAAMLLHHLVELPSRVGLLQTFSATRSAHALGADPSPNWGRRCVAWLAQYGLAFWRLVFSQAMLGLAGVLTAGYLFADAGLFNFRDARLIERVVDQSADEFKGVQFDQDAVLEGLSIEEQPDGSYQIQMVWALKEARRPTRFIHICDSSGKILRHGPSNQSMFARATGNETVLDRVLISKNQLESAAMLAIGFFGHERKSSPIVDPDPGQPTHRLPILWLEQAQ